MDEDVTAGGDNSVPQRELSALLSGSIAAFAYSGDPTISSGPTFKDWPIAFPDQSAHALSKEHPGNVSVYVVGGSQGSGPAIMSSDPSRGAVSGREKALAWEKMVKRVVSSIPFKRKLRSDLDSGSHE